MRQRVDPPDHPAPDRGPLPLAAAVRRIFPDLAPWVERYAKRFGALPLREPAAGAPGGRRVILEIIGAADDERACVAPGCAHEQCPEYWVPPTPGVHPGVELARRLRESAAYELVFKNGDAAWEPLSIPLVEGPEPAPGEEQSTFPIDYFNSKWWQHDIGIRITNVECAALTPASKPQINKAIKDTYDAAAKSGEKAPNVNQLVSPVKKRLAEIGKSASRDVIRSIAADPKFENQRLPQGQKWRDR
ncbi:MAG TPA: hypothetical protein VGF34_04790 [Stellaceae bacterium]|jgi:hypothetical protein